MSLLQAIALGILQGITEFVPVSSHAHLLLVPWLFGWSESGLVFDMMAHWGTLVAALVFFRHDVGRIVFATLRDLARRQPVASAESRLGWLLVLASIPAALFGFLFEDWIEGQLSAPAIVAGTLILTGALIWLGETLGRRTRSFESINTADAVGIGLAQAVAVVPGISRSGATIAMGLARGLERPAAARFSFLMMLPIVFGAGLLKLLEALEAGITRADATLMAVGFLSAALAGYACITFLLRFLAARSARPFAVYCFVFGAFCLLIALVR